MDAFEAGLPVFRGANGEVAIRPADAARYLAD